MGTWAIKIDLFQHQMSYNYEKLENSEEQSDVSIIMPAESNSGHTLQSNQSATGNLQNILTQEEIEFLDNEGLWARNPVRMHQIICKMRRKIENDSNAGTTNSPTVDRKLIAQAERIELRERVKKCDRNFKLVVSSIAIIAFFILLFIGSFNGPS